MERSGFTHNVIYDYTLGLTLYVQFVCCIHGYDYYNYYDEDLAYNQTLPIFIPINNNFTYYRGELAKLKCEVDNLGTKTLSWRKTSDPNPLTIGLSKFVKDPRFSVHEMKKNREWSLLIKRVEVSDAGVYECQVSSRQRNLRWMMRLNVIDGPLPRGKANSQDIQITGPLYIEKGNPVILVCNATGGEGPPDEIDWFKDGNKITTKTGRGIYITKNVSLTTGRIASTLKIQQTDMNDAGTYVCRTSGMQITSTKVHVLNAGTYNVKREMFETKQAGIKRKNSATLNKLSGHLLIDMIFVFLMTVYLNAR